MTKRTSAFILEGFEAFTAGDMVALTKLFYPDAECHAHVETGLVIDKLIDTFDKVASDAV